MKKENPFFKVFRILLLIVLSPIVLVYLICNKIKLAKKRKSEQDYVKICTLSQIDSLTGVQFEMFLKRLFEQMGYTVSLTKASKDYGADLIICKPPHRYIVQAKCYSHTVGIKAVQEIISARAHYGIMGAIVVTNREFSKEAKLLAQENNIILTDRSVLENVICKFDVKINLGQIGGRTLTDAETYAINQKYITNSVKM